MPLQIKNVHIGAAIERRLKELKMSKSELGRRINIPQQHINRMLEKDSIDTARLVSVCNAMDFNFFSLFSKSVQEQITAYIPTVATAGASVQNNVGKNRITNAHCPFSKEEHEKLTQEIKDKNKEIAVRNADIEKLNGQILLLEEQLNSKEEQMELHKANIQSKDDNIEQLKANIQSKDDIIALLKGQINELLKERRQDEI